MLGVQADLQRLDIVQAITRGTLPPDTTQEDAVEVARICPQFEALVLDAQHWIAKAKRALEDPTSLARLLALQNEGRNKFPALATQTAVDLVRRITAVYKWIPTENDVLKHRKPMSVLVRVYMDRFKDCKRSASQATERMEEEIAKAEAWCDKLNELVACKAEAAAFSNLLLAVQGNTQHQQQQQQQQQSDTTKSPSSSASSTGSSRIHVDPKDIKTAEEKLSCFCLCQRPAVDDVFMLGCDGCEDWFHPECVNTREDAIDANESYFCPRCSLRQNVPYAYGVIPGFHDSPPVMQGTLRALELPNFSAIKSSKTLENLTGGPTISTFSQSRIQPQGQPQADLLRKQQKRRPGAPLPMTTSSSTSSSVSSSSSSAPGAGLSSSSLSPAGVGAAAAAAAAMQAGSMPPAMLAGSLGGGLRRGLEALSDAAVAAAAANAGNAVHVESIMASSGGSTAFSNMSNLGFPSSTSSSSSSSSSTSSAGLGIAAGQNAHAVLNNSNGANFAGHLAEHEGLPPLQGPLASAAVAALQASSLAAASALQTGAGAGAGAGAAVIDPFEGMTEEEKKKKKAAIRAARRRAAAAALKEASAALAAESGQPEVIEYDSLGRKKPIRKRRPLSGSALLGSGSPTSTGAAGAAVGGTLLSNAEGQIAIDRALNAVLAAFPNEGRDPEAVAQLRKQITVLHAQQQQQLLLSGAAVGAGVTAGVATAAGAGAGIAGVNGGVGAGGSNGREEDVTQPQGVDQYTAAAVYANLLYDHLRDKVGNTRHSS